MNIVCAWCEREGRHALMGEREPLDNQQTTHGMCRRHHQELLARLPSKSFPGVRLLLVLRPTETKLYDYLVRNFAAVHGVRIIVDQRGGERAGTESRAVVQERRERERRTREGERSAFGYTVIRFGAAPVTNAIEL